MTDREDGFREADERVTPAVDLASRLTQAVYHALDDSEELSDGRSAICKHHVEAVCSLLDEMESSLPPQPGYVAAAAANLRYALTAPQGTFREGIEAAAKVCDSIHETDACANPAEKAAAAIRALLPPDSDSVRVPKSIFDGALRYIQHVGANHTMRGKPHPQQWIVDGLLAAQERREG